MTAEFPHDSRKAPAGTSSEMTWTLAWLFPKVRDQSDHRLSIGAMAPHYLFILSLPYCGSTILWRLIGTSPHASLLPKEGQMLAEVSHVMRSDPWNPACTLPWEEIRE